MMTQPLTLDDRHIDTSDGRMFARVWRSGHPHEGQAPIVLFHDSLGCVELWRQFPESLCLATGRTVIALIARFLRSAGEPA